MSRISIHALAIGNMHSSWVNFGAHIPLHDFICLGLPDIHTMHVLFHGSLVFDSIIRRAALDHKVILVDGYCLVEHLLFFRSLIVYRRLFVNLVDLAAVQVRLLRLHACSIYWSESILFSMCSMQFVCFCLLLFL